ncbi:unnamed protein product [Agarophyton chilense]
MDGLSPSRSHISAPSSELPNVSASSDLLHHIPSLQADYDCLDANDPPVRISWFPVLPFIGISPRDPSDPCYRALAKLKMMKSQHGIENVSLHDFVLAVTVFTTMVNRHAKKAMKRARHTLKESTKLTGGRRTGTSQSHGNMDALRLELPERVLGGPSTNPFHEFDAQVLQVPRSIPAKDVSNPRRRSLSSFHTIARESDHNPEERRRRWSLPEQSHQNQPNFLSEMFSAGSTAIPQYPEWHQHELGSFLDSPPKIRPEHVQLMHHMLRHAESIYGLPLNVPSAPRVSLTNLTDRRIVCARTGVKQSDLMYTDFQTESFLPAHYVAVDRQIKAVVVCIRGTANFVDLLTDMAATTDPLRIRRERPVANGKGIVEGFGHAGIVRSARNVFSRIRDVTLRCLRENQGFELLVTGHSLGAAAASVLALIMRDDSDFPRATAVCIAPPPCMTVELAEETVSNTITLVNGPDIVPRLSVAVLIPFFATAQYVSSLNPAKKALLSIGLKNPVIDWKELYRHNRETVPQLRKHHEGKKLYIPGKVFQLVRRKGVKSAECSRARWFRRPVVEVVPVSRVCFNQTPERERGMFLSHAPFNYKVSLLLALKQMGSSPLRKMSAGSVLSNLFSLPVVSKFRSDLRVGGKGAESLDGLLRKLTQDGSESPVP